MNNYGFIGLVSRLFIKKHMREVHLVMFHVKTCKFSSKTNSIIIYQSRVANREHPHFVQLLAMA